MVPFEGDCEIPDGDIVLLHGCEDAMIILEPVQETILEPDANVRFVVGDPAFKAIQNSSAATLITGEKSQSILHKQGMKRRRKRRDNKLKKRMERHFHEVSGTAHSFSSKNF